MSVVIERVRLSRFLQFAYPALVFFSVLFAWNSVGQVNGIADLGSPRFEPNNFHRYPKTSPAPASLTCDAEKLGLLDVSSCSEQTTPPLQLIDTNELYKSSLGSTAASGTNLN